LKLPIFFPIKKQQAINLLKPIYSPIKSRGKTPVSFGLALVLFWSSFAHVLLIPKQTKRKPKEDQNERRTRPKQKI